MAVKVTLREKPISKGRKSLYLDFYPGIIDHKTGQETRREFLKLYIFEKPKNPIDKAHNKETLDIANAIRQRRENEINKPEIYTEFEKEQLRNKELGEKDFIEYYTQLAYKRRNSNHDNWMSALNYLNDFTGGKLKFSEVNEKFMEDFRYFLLNAQSRRSKKTKLARNSAVSYFNKVKAALKQAYKDRLLQYDLNVSVPQIKAEEPQRNYLTKEELSTLANTPCNNPLLKDAALFSCLTGLRFSDIKKLTWGEVERNNEGYQLKFRQKKTKGSEVLPISKQALELMGERGNPDEKVFKGLKYSAYENRHLYQWIGAAGIIRDITFHCFRHTFAVLQLEAGTDIVTLSKMLGHRELKTTMIYAKVVDRLKREAANRVNY
jgi:integrase